MDGDRVSYARGAPKGHSIYRHAAHPQAAVAYPGRQERDTEHLSACRRRDPVLRSVCRVLEKNLDTTPVTARCLGKYYFTDGDNLERLLQGFAERVPGVGTAGTRKGQGAAARQHGRASER